MVIHTTLIGNKDGIYIDPRNCNAYVDPRDCTNYNDVDMEGVTSLVIYRSKTGAMTIAQANGYTIDKGIFFNNYTVKEDHND